MDFLTPFQERFAQISDDEVKEILENGAQRARKQAQQKMQEVRDKIGFVV